MNPETPPVRMEFTPEVAGAFDAAVSAMNSLGLVPTINSAYRTFADQSYFASGGSGSNSAASVGTSPHQAGQAVDINGTKSPQFATISTVMQIFGFSRYNPPDKDPPHFQMVSGDRASQIALAAAYRAVCSVAPRQ
jgi:LAS superfamily LD-carboxypeptidase LdcB